MSAAPFPPARPPPRPHGLQHHSLLGASIVPPVPRASRSSSSPLCGCGRSTWTRSSPTADETPPTNRQERVCPLAPAPVFIESPATTTFTTTTCGGSNVASTRFFAWRDQRSVSTSSTSTRNSGASSRVEDRTVGRPGVGDGDVAGSVHSFPAVRVVAGGSWRCYPPTEGLATYWCELTKSRSLFCGQSRSSQVVHLHHAAKGRK
jgi:hypothetical protein